MSSVSPAPARHTIESVPAQARLAVLPQPRLWALWATLLAVLVLVLGAVVTQLRQVAPAELTVDQELSRDHNGVLTALALAVDAALSPVGNLVILGVLFLYLVLVRRAPVNAIVVTAVAGIGWLSSEAFKLAIARPRLDSTLLADPLVSEQGHDSFPSGHTSFAVSLAIALYLLARNTRWAKLAAVGGSIFALAVGASRVYLGAHYPSDVLGAFLGPLAAILFFIGIWNLVGMRVLDRLPFLTRFGPVPG
ncbi:phosphatase PAP2 family protein [Microterricola viridarii]|uniref:phosphatase PAP2 family protein n=1 Tax=Microterricola viridarii TaxID=412690 RepID=UPI0009E894D2|nr:phosphatase PAP2 family protein [Microterricola viridarii]